MENKYYTPSIDEFYEGFEYQEEIPSLHINLNMGEQAPGDLVWRDFKFSRTSHFIYNNKEDEFTCSLDQDIKDGTVRVKYLDKADIESLGFGYTDEFLDSCIFYRETYRLIFDPENQGVVIDDGEDYENTPYQYFSGTIKNKSELKVLLKQLGIYGDSN